MEEIAFVAPLGPIAWGGWLCHRARRADPAHAATWAWFTAGAAYALAVGLLALVAIVAGGGLELALRAGAGTTALVLAGVVAMARSALPGLRRDALLDAAVAVLVVIVVAVWAVGVPGVRTGDPFLTLVFGLDLVAFTVAACVAASSASPHDRRIGRWLGAAGLCIVVADGLVVAEASGLLVAPELAVAGGWTLAAAILCRAARSACAPGPDPAPEREPDARWVLGRVLVPFTAVLTLPLASLALVVILERPLWAWERRLLGVSFLLVVVLVFARQALLLLEHSRAERRERRLREEVQLRHDERLEQSIRDPLTGCYNRRFFFDALEKEVQRARRYDTQSALILFDVDDFKAVNDTFGHGHGDEVLRRVAAILEPLLRPVDSFARIGGEEFAVLLPETSQLDALLVADRLRTAVARARILEGRRVTLSGGVGCCPADAETREELLRRTDAALYWAKRNGKDLCALTSDAIAAELAGETLAEAARGAHLYGLVASIDGQSRYTRDHSENVAAYASALGQALGLERERMIVLRRAALLHDIGKVAVPVGILSKTEKLSDADFEEIKRHSWVGATMLLRAGMEEEARFVRHHHERFDGRGYPDSIAGEAIPFEARILFVCDSFEAMTSDRAYRDGMPVADALEELERCAGSQFDPVVVEAFRGLVERDELPLAALRV